MILAAAVSVSAGSNEYLKKKTLEILDTYCPDGSKIVRMCMPLYPTVSEHDFTFWIDGSDERACLTSLNTVVHEENHSANVFISRDILQKKFGKESDLFYQYDYYYLKDSRFSLLRKTPTFPSIEMVGTFPEHLRTFRFDTYINTQNAVQSTQNEGIYGLLDEMNSYYQGTKASFDLLGYFEKKGDTADWHDYFSGVHSTHYGCLEFRLYILKYLMFAERKHPKIYQGILNNKAWCGTFLEIDRNVSELLKSYSSAKQAVFKRLKGYGWTVYEDDQTLSIETNGRTVSHINFMGVIRLLTEEMKKPEYQAVLREIQTHAEGWDPESVYLEIAQAMRETDGDHTEGNGTHVSLPRLANRRPLEEIAGLSDPEGDAAHPFIDLTGALVSRDGDGLTVRMEFAGFPDRLTFHQADVPDNWMEYRWAALFDLEGNGTDDFSIELSNFKAPGSKTVQADPLEEAQLTVWILSDEGGKASQVLFRAGRIGNTLIFDVPVCDLVSSINSGTQVRFETYFTDGRIQGRDLMPDESE